MAQNENETNKPESRWHKILVLFSQHRLIIAGIILVAALLVVTPLFYTFFSTRNSRYDLTTQPVNVVPYHKVALVFGAGIMSNGQPTPYLSNRIKTAVALYKAGKVHILLMSGDNSRRSHNEPTVMKNYAVKLGVPASAIREDYAGFNTYDSCYRAHYIFKLNSATLISQGYHLPRAMVTCAGLGVKNSGVVATHPSRDFTINYILREFLSTDKMVFQLIFKPHPTVLGQPLPIN